MVADGRDFNPSNKKFVDNFQKLSGFKSRKGHLTTQDKDSYFQEGTITKIIKDKVYLNGWEVKLDNNKVKWCTYEPDGMIILPEYTETSKYFVPKKDHNKCQVLINESEKKYRIVNIYGLETFFTSAADGLVMLDAGDKDNSVLVLKNDSTKVSLINSQVVIDADSLIVSDTDVINEIDNSKKDISNIKTAFESGVKSAISTFRIDNGLIE